MLILGIFYLCVESGCAVLFLHVWCTLKLPPSSTFFLLKSVILVPSEFLCRFFFSFSLSFIDFFDWKNLIPLISLPLFFFLFIFSFFLVLKNPQNCKLSHFENVNWHQYRYMNTFFLSDIWLAILVIFMWETMSCFMLEANICTVSTSRYFLFNNWGTFHDWALRTLHGDP